MNQSLCDFLLYSRVGQNSEISIQYDYVIIIIIIIIKGLHISNIE